MVHIIFLAWRSPPPNDMWNDLEKINFKLLSGDLQKLVCVLHHFSRSGERRSLNFHESLSNLFPWTVRSLHHKWKYLELQPLPEHIICYIILKILLTLIICHNHMCKYCQTIISHYYNCLYCIRAELFLYHRKLL